MRGAAEGPFRHPPTPRYPTPHSLQHRTARGQSEHIKLSPSQKDPALLPAYQHRDPQGKGRLLEREGESDNYCGTEGSTSSTMCPLEGKAFIWAQSKSLEEKQETGILQTQHYIPSSKRKCFRVVGCFRQQQNYKHIMYSS